MKDPGHTDYIMFVHRFASDGTIGEMDCVYSAWSTRASRGFQRRQHRGAAPPRAGAGARHQERRAGHASPARWSRSISAATPAGACSRAASSAASPTASRRSLWFSDLRSFTTITDTAPPGEIIPLLNDYAEAVITAIHEAGGDVLKLIGDGTLAIFRADDPAEACAPRAAGRGARMRRRVKELNEKRRAEERPTTSVYVGLHIGEVFYGNIGSVDRLDFTVVGPAVNETSRIASMCRSVDRPVLISSAFADALPAAERSKSRVGRPLRPARRRPAPRSCSRSIPRRSDSRLAKI